MTTFRHRWGPFCLWLFQASISNPKKTMIHFPYVNYCSFYPTYSDACRHLRGLVAFRWSWRVFFRPLGDVQDEEKQNFLPKNQLHTYFAEAFWLFSVFFLRPENGVMLPYEFQLFWWWFFSDAFSVIVIPTGMRLVAPGCDCSSPTVYPRNFLKEMYPWKFLN